MTIYSYRCPNCGDAEERNVPMDERDLQLCGCGNCTVRQLGAPRFRFAGRVTPGGGPDKFTADVLGIPLHDLPSGLKTKDSK